MTDVRPNGFIEMRARAELLGSVGAGVLGAGLALLFREALADLAAAITEGRRPQPLEPVGEPPDPTLPPLLRGRLTRLRRQLKTLHDAVERQVAASRLANQRGKL